MTDKDAMPALDWVGSPVPELRRVYAEARAALLVDYPEDVDAFTLAEPGLSGLRFVPAGGGRGAPVLYFHGGGWVVGSPETHRVLCAWLAKLSGREVYSVAYRLAPEHAFPAQPQDAIAALSALLARFDQVFVAGDSAGGAMALWAESGVSVSERTRVLGVASFYGAFGVTDSQSLRALGDSGAGLDIPSVKAFYTRMGLDDPLEVQDWISTMGAPVYLMIAEADSLADDSAQIAKLMTGRRLTEVTAAGQPHAFLQNVGQDEVARAEMERATTWMSEVEAAS